MSAYASDDVILKCLSFNECFCSFSPLKRFNSIAPFSQPLIVNNFSSTKKSKETKKKTSEFEENFHFHCVLLNCWKMIRILRWFYTFVFPHLSPFHSMFRILLLFASVADVTLILSWFHQMKKKKNAVNSQWFVSTTVVLAKAMKWCDKRQLL